MGGKFITKPSESMVEEVERWFNFLPSDPIRIETDEIHHLVSDAFNLLMMDGQSSGKSTCRLKEAIESAITCATKICGNYDLLSGEAYILQIVDSATAPLSIEEIKAINEFCSELRADVDLVWGISRIENESNIGVKIAAKNLKITQAWE